MRVKCLVHKHSTMDVPSQTASMSVPKKYLLCHHHMSFKLSAEYFAFLSYSCSSQHFITKTFIVYRFGFKSFLPEFKLFVQTLLLLLSVARYLNLHPFNVLSLVLSHYFIWHIFVSSFLPNVHFCLKVICFSHPTTLTSINCIAVSVDLFCFRIYLFFFICCF